MPHVHLITSFIRYLLCYVMGRFGHENGPFWMLAGAVLVLFFLPLGPFWSGPFWFAWAVFDLHRGRFGDGPFWSVPPSNWWLLTDNFVTYCRSVTWRVCTTLSLHVWAVLIVTRGVNWWHFVHCWLLSFHDDFSKFKPNSVILSLLHLVKNST